MSEWTARKTAIAVGVLFVLMLLLALVVEEAKVSSALEWTRTLVGIIVMAAGLASSVTAVRDERVTEKMLAFGPGVIGVLAGSALLGFGDWAVPAALGIAGLGTGVWFGLRRQ